MQTRDNAVDVPIDRIRARFQTSLEELTAELASLADAADGADDVTRFELDVRLSATQERVARVREALAAVDAGTYGRCSRCGVRIPDERMDAVITTTLCVVCSDP